MYSFFSEGKGRRVRVWLTVGLPVDCVLFMFGGTHLKNFATHEALYCLFPKASLEHREMVVATGGRLSELKFFAKYLDRGFRRASGRSVLKNEEFQGGRFLGDSKTKVVPYDGSMKVGPLSGKRFRVTEDGVFVRCAG